jgi:hypothetical protein
LFIILKLIFLELFYLDSRLRLTHRMSSAMDLPSYIVVEGMPNGTVHVSKEGMTYVIKDGFVIEAFATTTAKAVPIVYLPMGSTYTHIVPAPAPAPSAPPADLEELEAHGARAEREQRARTALLKLVLHRRGLALSAMLQTSTV